MAVHRFYLTKRKFTKNKEFAIKYKGTINEYIWKGYARKLSQEEANRITSITSYNTHHGILNPNKPGKLRVVFNAAAYFSNTYLNDHLVD